jgi:hypothetical protein
MYVCMHVWVYVRTKTFGRNISRFGACVCVHVNACMCASVCMYACMHVCILKERRFLRRRFLKCMHVSMYELYM